jgi:hypothetical protein
MASQRVRTLSLDLPHLHAFVDLPFSSHENITIGWLNVAERFFSLQRHNRAAPTRYSLLCWGVCVANSENVTAPLGGDGA